MSEYWMQTSTGSAIDILEPDPATIRLQDMAIMLSRIPRFTGGTKPSVCINVAEHSLLVEQLAPLGTAPVTRLHLLFHDGHEIITGDIASPLKQVFRLQAGWINTIYFVSKALQAAIEQAANLPAPTTEELALIKRYDLEALAIEKRDCMTPMDWGWDLPDVSKQTVMMLPDGATHARVRFRTRALNLLCSAGIIPRRTFLDGI